jgi:hypothetical protein
MSLFPQKFWRQIWDDVFFLDVFNVVVAPVETLFRLAAIECGVVIQNDVGRQFDFVSLVKTADVEKLRVAAASMERFGRRNFKIVFLFFKL